MFYDFECCQDLERWKKSNVDMPRVGGVPVSTVVHHSYGQPYFLYSLPTSTASRTTTNTPITIQSHMPVPIAFPIHPPELNIMRLSSRYLWVRRRLPSCLIRTSTIY